MGVQRTLVVGFVMFWTCFKFNDCSSCSRDFARVVRNLVQKNMDPVFEAVGTGIPTSCPFNKDLDLYRAQEDHKTMEGMSKWACDFCGKSFFAEYYLDQHFQNRHSEYERKKSDSVCLADYCDIFRCDVVSGSRKADFWDVSLCLEDDMMEVKKKCEEILNDCIPKHLSQNSTRTMKDQLSEGVCSYLTCSKFWNSPIPQGDESKAVMYAVFTVMLVIILTIYYCVAYHYFCSDTFSADTYETYEHARPQVHVDSHRRVRARRRERTRSEES